jgi:long-chain acyl-CoA synthetase
VDVPELGYLHTDRMHHDTIPCEGRGEVWVRGPGVFKGYYKDEEETEAVGIRDPGGWLRSGDIGNVLPYTTVLFCYRRGEVD